jgi:hypothetical protein
LIQIALLLVFAFQSAPQKQSVSSDEAAIQALIGSLEKHRAAPTDLLDPDLERERRQKSLAEFEDKLYQVSFYERSPLVFADRSHASMDTGVHFKDGHSEADMTTTIQFIRRDGRWYFASYEFMDAPPILIAVIVVAAAVGIGFATMVLVLRARLRRAGKLDWKRQVVVFIPFAWSTLWRESQY